MSIEKRSHGVWDGKSSALWRLPAALAVTGLAWKYNPVEAYINVDNSSHQIQLHEGMPYRVMAPGVSHDEVKPFQPTGENEFVIVVPGIVGDGPPQSPVTAQEVPLPQPTPEIEYFPSGKVLDESEYSVWQVLRDCETGDGSVGAPYYVEWDYNGPSGFDGAYQFLDTTWSSLEAAQGYDFAWQAPPSVQTAAAIELQSKYGWGQWPSCTGRMSAEGYIG